MNNTLKYGIILFVAFILAFLFLLTVGHAYNLGYEEGSQDAISFLQPNDTCDQYYNLGYDDATEMCMQEACNVCSLID